MCLVSYWKQSKSKNSASITLWSSKSEGAVLGIALGLFENAGLGIALGLFENAGLGIALGLLEGAGKDVQSKLISISWTYAAAKERAK